MGLNYKKKLYAFFGFGYRHWGPGQPDEWQGHLYEGGEDCAQLTKKADINDNHCSLKLKFICKGSKDS